MTTYCDYCYATDHQRWNCPKLSAEAKAKEDKDLALREADDASTEELEAAGEIWDQRVALTDAEGDPYSALQQESADARREAMENR